MPTSSYQPCTQIPGCRANHNGRCAALESTTFKTGICPFYKTNARCHKEGNETYDRLVILKRQDLIEKYNLRRRPDVSE